MIQKILATSGVLLTTNSQPWCAEANNYSGAFWYDVCRAENMQTVCLTYLQGITDSLDYLGYVVKKPFVCIPPTVTPTQLRLMLVRQMEKEPQYLGTPASGIVIRMLQENYGCNKN